MPVAASHILDFLDEHESFVAERHEVASPAFRNLRQSLRQIVLKLRDSDDPEALEISAGLRGLLSEWLTVPVPFDRAMHDAVNEQLGEAYTVQARWGRDIRTLYDKALSAAEDLPSIENPVREKLRTVIQELRLRERRFKVYCHRRARPHFESIFMAPSDFPLSESKFLHSVRDYRETEPFDVLIKVGPLRSRGWGSAPDALLNSPRFGTLVLVFWSGCRDEPDFGYDPSSLDSPDSAGLAAAARTGGGPLKWTTWVTRSGEDTMDVPGYAAEADELQVFRQINPTRGNRPARLVQVDGQHGILYPPYSPVFSFDSGSTTREPFARRIPGETLLEGMFVIWPLLAEVDLGFVQARHGYYSQIWKERLEKAWSTDDAGLIRRLRGAGLNLINLAGAIRNWCRPPGTVIHAPQQIRHFEILLRVLGVNSAMIQGPGETSAPLWKLAWNEVRRSRGEASQAGVLEQEIVDEQLLVVLRSLLPLIRDKARTNVGFNISMPPENSLKGHLSFLRVYGIEEGFSVPDAQLKIVHELSMIDQWRD